MGIYDRDYNRPQQYRETRFAMSPLTPVVKWLLIINGIAFFISMVAESRTPSGYFSPIDIWFSVYPYDISGMLQPWRYITYQFLHGGLGHIFFNMLALFFLGPLFERQWGSKFFLRFYLICGAAGGILYALLVAFDVLGVGILVGASGAIYGLLAAAVIFYPNMRVYIYGIFPIQMAVLVPILIAMSVFGFMRGNNAGGEAAHLAGLAAGFILIKNRGLFSKFTVKRNKGNWQKKMQNQQDFQAEVNRILGKVGTEGINSLTQKEKDTLQRATELEQRQ